MASDDKTKVQKKPTVNPQSMENSKNNTVSIPPSSPVELSGDTLLKIGHFLNCNLQIML